MPAHQVTITKYDHRHLPRASYTGELVFRDEEVIVARCLWTREEPLAVGPLLLEQGDIFMEHYYPREWFNIMGIYDAAGILRGWYCNLTEPARIADGKIGWHDLALDLVVLPDGRAILLDEDEFEALRLTAALRSQVWCAVERLRYWVETRHRPFDSRVGRP